MIKRSNTALRLLEWIATAHIIGGLALALLWWVPALHPQVLHAMQLQIQPNQVTDVVFWICILGPTIASWGLLFKLGLWSFSSNPNRYAYRLLQLSIVIWAPLDAMMCFTHQLYLLVILDLSVVVIVLTLLHYARRTVLPKTTHQ